MLISERIYKFMDEKNISQLEFAKRTLKPNVWEFFYGINYSINCNPEISESIISE